MEASRQRLGWGAGLASLVVLVAILASVQHAADVEEPVVEEQGDLNHQGHVFTMLHNMAALQAFCKHIGSVRKRAVMPCPAGATHPCCTERQLKMAKMQGSAPTNFNWADPSSWSGSKGSAATHLAHKAAMSGMSSPGAASAWQTTAPAPAPMMMAQQAPPQQPMYPQAPQQPMYAQQLPQQGYYPHLLPGQAGVPEGGAVAAQQYQEPYAPQQMPPQQQMAAPYGNYVAPEQGPAMAPQQPVYQQQPMYEPMYPQQQMYQQAPPMQPQGYPQPAGYAAQPMAPQGYAQPPV